MTINYSVDLRLVSDLVGAPVDELVALNPSLLRMITPPDTPVRSAPAGRHRRALRRADRGHPRKPSATPGAIIPWSPEDTLASVARTYRVAAFRTGCGQSVERDGQARKALRRSSFRFRSLQRRSAHTVLYTDAQGRYAGLHRRSLRRLAHPVAALEQVAVSGIKVDAGRRLHVAEPVRVAAAAASSRHGFSGKTSAPREATQHLRRTVPTRLLIQDETRYAHPQSRRIGTSKGAKSAGQRSISSHPKEESHRISVAQKIMHATSMPALVF